jgi:hypothetical protein
VTADDHWVRWHDAYEDPNSSLSRRLAIVQARLRDALDVAAPGPIRLLSMCAGQGRDVIGVLASHPRRSDVRATLVELDATLVAAARAMATNAGLDLDIIEGDAALTDNYAGIVPADIAMVCGLFGNISDADIRATIAELPHLVGPDATAIWTRHRLEPDATPMIRQWFIDEGFEEVAFDTADGHALGVGTARFRGTPEPFRPGRRLFTFIGDGLGAHV